MRIANSINNLILKAKKSFFVKSILKVVFGTVLAQLLTLSAIPFLTRVYSVESFGLLGIYIAFSSIAKVVFSCRYDFAIPTAKGNSEASYLLWLTLIFSGFFCALSYLIIYLSSIPYIEKFGDAKYFIPFMLFISSVDNILSLWINRIKLFGVFSTSRVIRAFSIATFQILIGIFIGVYEGLLYGLLLGEVVTVLFILFKLHYSSFVKIRNPSLNRILMVLKKYKNNLFYLLPGHTLNMGVSQLPIIIIETIYGATAAGLLYMAIKIVSLPGQLISAAVFRVFFSEAARVYNKTGTCYNLAIKTIFGAALICIPLFIFIDIVTYNFIGQILGEEWNAAKYTIIIYSVIEILPAIFYTISGIWFITNHQKANLKYQLLRSGIIACGLLIGVSIGGYYITLISYGIFRIIAFSIFTKKCISLSKGVCRD